MLNLKLKIIYGAIRVRLENGETITEIMESYPKLAEKEKKILVAELKKNKLL